MPEGGESVLFNATILTGQGEIGHVNKHTFRQIVHCPGHSLGDASVEGHKIVQFISGFLGFTG